MMRPRPAVEVLFGRAPEAVRGIEGDFALLDDAWAGNRTRVWTCPEVAVVLGVSRDCQAEVDLDQCRARSVSVLRRASGGGTVVIGPGTLQYAIVVPHGGRRPSDPEHPQTPSWTSEPTLDEVKRLGSRLAIEALTAAGVRGTISSDSSGDLQVGDRKVAGVALRRVRGATLLHASLLLDADLEGIATLLRHPAREPAWRRGRSHGEFLANLGAVDARVFEKALARKGGGAG